MTQDSETTKETVVETTETETTTSEPKVTKEVITETSGSSDDD